MRDDPRAAIGEVGVELFYAAAHLLGGGDAALDEQLLHGAAHDLVLGRRAAIETAVCAAIWRMVVVVFHAGSSQCS